MNRILLLSSFILLMMSGLDAQTYRYDDSFGPQGFSLVSHDRLGVTVNFSIREFSMEEMDIKGDRMQHLSFPGHFLPGDEGTPDLPGDGRFIAVPNGAKPVISVKTARREVIRDVDIAPAPNLPLDNDDRPVVYKKNAKIYSTDAYFPAEPVKLSGKMSIRGVDAFVLGITPFQYNPVKRELVILRDMEVEIRFEGGSGDFGEERLRSRWWDPLMQDMFLNSADLPVVEYSKRVTSPNRATGCEYLIICPDGEEFIAWADTIRRFRNQQGILTEVFTISQVGGNNAMIIEDFINNAYYSWDIPPAACLLLGDYGSLPQNAITSSLLNDHPDDYNPYISDNPYADVTNDLLPDIAFARITARNAAELELMIGKALDYERNPPTSEYFYHHPITALGWQTERWFQICSEAVGGYFRTKGKEPIRINEVYGGDPDADPWSIAGNTPAILSTFGPEGLGYIPATPGELGNWEGGNANDINQAVNNGAFLLQHRDHGNENGWGEPYYTRNEISGLQNTELTFVMSINCQTGKFNSGSESFGEKFHRYQFNGEASGALGLIAPTEVSYSFVNDVFAWGFYDNLFPDFFPQFGTTPPSRGMYPAFGNAAGKYFLFASGWPSNPQHKSITYKLFHHHGDAFTGLFSEVPQALTVAHDSVMLAGTFFFDVEADEGSLIALSVNGELIGVATATGEPVPVEIIPQNPPYILDVVVTKENHFRHHSTVQIIPPQGPFVISQACHVNDTQGNGNGLLDYGETAVFDMTFDNLGNESAEDVVVHIYTDDEYVTIIDNETFAGTIAAGEVKEVEDAFSVTLADNVPDGHVVHFEMEATDGDSIWISTFAVKTHSPVLVYAEYAVADTGGNGNGRLDPGEEVGIVISLKNNGTASAYDVYGLLSSTDPYIEILSDSVMFGEVGPGETVTGAFTATAYVITMPGHEAGFDIDFSGNLGIAAADDFSLFIGLFPVLILDLDQNHNSADKMKAALDDLRIFSEILDEMPDDLSQYKTIFVCLGTYSDNHILTADEAGKLIGFLNGGGNLYMEGADTWYYDQLYSPTELHPMFNITGEDDGSNNLVTVNGITGTFTEGLSFFFSGDNNYIDHIVPGEGAYSIFTNSNPVYNLAIVNDAGNYKTIGTSFEFGGLMNNLNSSRKDLMLKYLDFFGMDAITQGPLLPVGDTLACSGSSSGIYTTHPVPDAHYYIWELLPASSGTVTGWDTTVTVEWTPGFEGTAVLKVCGMNENGLGPLSPGLAIHHFTSPAATVAFSDPVICPGDTTFMNITLTGSQPWQMLISLGGYQINLNPNKPIMDGIPLSPTADLEVTILALSDATGCIATGFPSNTLQVTQIPGIPATPAGPVYVDLYGATQSEYTVADTMPDNNYEWILLPQEAGNVILSDDGTVCTVDWTAGFTGEATLKMRGVNECGEGSFSDPLTVNVINSFGLKDGGVEPAISVFPNPSSGSFIIQINSNADISGIITLTNSSGEKILETERINLSFNSRFPVDAQFLTPGIYFIEIKTDKTVYRDKVVVK
ncbi:MAG TPA: C25 family cysteine peptidase [Bacteroidales bacterium]|nr:C25 family cysteine peptidase [Bacteroidales bacterium]